ncbi:MAG: outer membrane lipoprotein carrier protein LolA [Alphaproteobacteria bacterium]|nr:MAG: outer membrane lipoprotein carrier protein LolA [Alphaproteobacteria bacterium]
MPASGRSWCRNGKTDAVSRRPDIQRRFIRRRPYLRPRPNFAEQKMIASIPLALALLLSAPQTATPADVAVAATPATTADTDPAADLARIESYLNAIRSLKADFVQRSSDGSTARGRLMLERPGRLRFEYNDGTPLLLVSDGRTLSFIDYSIGQVTRWPIDDTPLALLVRDHIDLAAAGAVINRMPAADGTRRLVVSVRDPDQPERGLLSLDFADGPQGLALIGWEIVDAQGTVTRVTLTNLRAGVTLAASLWSFDDPRHAPEQRRRRRR